MAYRLAATDLHSTKVTYGDLATLDFATGTFSLGCWVKTEASIPGADDIFSKGFTSSNGWLFGIGTGNLIRIAGGDASGIAVAVGSGAIVTAVWTHIGVACKGGTAVFYINGVEDCKKDFISATVATADEVSLGSRSSTASKGAPVSVAHMMAWDYELPAAGWLQIYEGFLPGTQKLVFWDPCYGATGTSVVGHDLIGGATGTLTDAATDYLAASVQYPLGHPDPCFAKNYIIDTSPIVWQEDADTETLSEDATSVVGLVYEATETLELADGESTGDYATGDSMTLYDPDGIILEEATATDDTVATWVKKFPPFARRTYWTITE